MIKPVILILSPSTCSFSPRVVFGLCFGIKDCINTCLFACFALLEGTHLMIENDLRFGETQNKTEESVQEERNVIYAVPSEKF